MLERASGQFIIEGNVEEIFGGISGAARLARISQSCRFSGQLVGESMAEFTAALPREGDGSFHGFQRISGTLGEREGTFVMSVSGEIHKGQPRGLWTIVPKSGSGDFVHIRGEGTFSLPDGKPGRYQLEFDLRKPRAAKPTVTELVEEPPVVAVQSVDAVSPAVIAEAAAAPEKPARKPRGKPAAPVVEVVAEQSVKRSRARKVEPVVAEPALVPEMPAKRARSRTVEPVVVEPIADVSATPTRARTRTSAPVVAEQPVGEPTPKPKRARKPPTAEPIATVAEAAPEPAPAKPARRKKAAPPEPIALPVTEPTPTRKRRAEAA